MKVICMLLNGAITNDQRVIRMINILFSKSIAQLFYTNSSFEKMILEHFITIEEK